MATLSKILFPSYPGNLAGSILLLATRLIFGATFMTHGLQKWANIEELSKTFPNPLGLGSEVSLALVIFAELICPVAVILGFLHRLALIPMIITMSIAFFVIHGADPFALRELSLLYLALFILLLFAGPGRLSIDSLIGRSINKRNRASAFGYHSGSGLDYSR